MVQKDNKIRKIAKYFIKEPAIGITILCAILLVWLIPAFVLFADRQIAVYGTIVIVIGFLITVYILGFNKQ